MSAKQFWRGDPSLTRAYRKAYDLKRRERNWEMWMQGAYFYDALAKIAPYMRAALSSTRVEPGKYVEKPFPLTEKEAREREEEARRQQFERMIQMLDKESAENARKRREEQDKAQEKARKPETLKKKPRTGRRKTKEAGGNADQH